MRQWGRRLWIEFAPHASYDSRYVIDHSRKRYHPARDTNTSKHIRALKMWLAGLALLIVAMILVGGATRLTDSGLSITEWKPIMGAVPPLNDADWQTAFAAYQKIPEYTELKRGMSLDEFKTIFWWEWAHRFLGRLIGFVFLVPFVGFLIAGYIPRTLLPEAARPICAGQPSRRARLVHGEERAGRSHRCQSIPARRAFRRGAVILGYTLWLLFGLGDEPPAGPGRGWRAPAYVAWAILALIFLQLLAGALVAGLDAGMGHNTWPLINGALVPTGCMRPRLGIATSSRTRLRFSSITA